MRTTVEECEQAIAMLHEKLHTATRRSHEIATDRQRLSYAVFVDGDPSARVDLEKLNAIAIADKIENIKAAIAEANKRLTVARDAVARDVDKEHARNALATLEDLLALAPKLDELVPHPHPEEGVAVYSQADPPTVCAAAKLVAELVNHLRALKLTTAAFPACWHGAAGKMDLEKALMKTISAGWPSIAVDVAPRQRASGRAWPAPARTPQFTRILNGWGAVIRKSLEQMNREEAHAA